MCVKATFVYLLNSVAIVARFVHFQPVPGAPVSAQLNKSNALHL